MKKRKIAIFCFLALLVLGLCFAGCAEKEETPGTVTPKPEPEPEKQIYSEIIDAEDIDKFSSSVAEYRVLDGRNIEVCFTGQGDNSLEVNYGSINIDVRVSTSVYRYFVIKLLRNDHLASVHLSTNNQEKTIWGDFAGTGIFVCDLQTLNEKAFISDDITLNVSIWTVSSGINDASSVVFESAGFYAEPPFYEDFTDNSKFTVTDAEADESDGYIKYVANGTAAKITKEANIDFEHNSYIDFGVYAATGNYALNMTGPDGNVFKLVENGQGGGKNYRVNVSDLGLKDSGTYKFEIVFDGEISLSNLSVSADEVLNFDSFDADSLKSVNDNNMVRLDAENDALKISIASEGYASLYGFINTASFPALEIEISEVMAERVSFVLVTQGSQFNAESNIVQPGVYTINFNEFGYYGEFGYELRICVSGDMGDYVKISSIKTTDEGMKPNLPMVNEKDFKHVTWGGAAATEIVDGKLRVKQERDLGFAESVKMFKIDLDKYPYLRISVSDVVGEWNFKAVIDGTEYLCFPTDTNKTGIFYFDLKANYPNGGIKEVELQIFTVGGTGAAYVDIEEVLSIKEMPVLDYTAPELPGATTGVDYSFDLNTGYGGYRFELKADSELPQGLVLANGVISGTPTIVGVSEFTMIIRNAEGVSGEYVFRIEVAKGTYGKAPVPVVTEVEETSITAEAGETGDNMEFAIRVKGSQEELVWLGNDTNAYTFDSLEADTEYEIYARYKGNDNFNTGEASEAKISRTGITVNKFSVTYDFGGHRENIVVADVVEGTTNITPPDVSVNGFNFYGWYSDDSYTKLYDFSSSIEKNTVIYAKLINYADERYDFAYCGEWYWDGYTAPVVDGSVNFTQKNDYNFTSVDKTLVIDIDQYPYIRVTVELGEGAQWGLEAVTADGVRFISDSSQDGTFYFDLRTKYPGGGTQAVQFRLYVVGAQNAALVKLTELVSLSELPVLDYDAPALNDACTGEEYSFDLNPDNKAYTFELPEGSVLPQGLVLKDGIISGVPQVAAPEGASFKILVKDNVGLTKEITLQIIVNRGKAGKISQPVVFGMTENSVIVSAGEDTDVVEFAIRQAGSLEELVWVESSNNQYTFTDLTAGAQYEIYARYAENENYLTGDASEALVWQCGEAPRLFTVTFDFGGVADNITREVALGGFVDISDIDVPADNYNFYGWFEDESFKQSFDFTNPITDHTTVYAKLTQYADEMFDGANQWQSASGLQVQYLDGTMYVTAGSEQWCSVEKEFFIDADRYPFLFIRFRGDNSAVGVKYSVNGGEDTIYNDNFGAENTEVVLDFSQHNGVIKVKVKIYNQSTNASFCVTDVYSGADGSAMTDLEKDAGGEVLNISYDEEKNVSTIDKSVNGWYVAQKNFIVDVEKTPYLKISVSSNMAGAYLIYFNSDGTKTISNDRNAIRADGTRVLVSGDQWLNSGTYYVNLKDFLSGIANFSVHFKTGGDPCNFTVDEISFLPSLDSVHVYETFFGGMQQIAVSSDGITVIADVAWKYAYSYTNIDFSQTKVLTLNAKVTSRSFMLKINGKIVSAELENEFNKFADGDCWIDADTAFAIDLTQVTPLDNACNFCIEIVSNNNLNATFSDIVFSVN